ncbi:GNAT family N-acetyltransferase [uncultured Arthrobacter sp.]|uniref:GNAT family N-acetyltransferase n=1 Tax=uncultured Arthrobacter sp. TaxID=114050 RepID=UPI00262170AA|nr:GNAT family N-acetyltransferase [uncultured Arthrobacter sp.]
MLIREAGLADIIGVDEICDASGRSRWSPNLLRVKQDRQVLVAEVEGKVIGVAKTHFHEDSGGDGPAGHYLGGIVVAREYRRQGVATALTKKRLDWIWSVAGTAYYFANEHNIASIRMHEGFGFRELGRFANIHGVTADDGQSYLILFEAHR